MLKLKKIWGVPCPSSVTSTLRFQRFHLGTPNECQLPIPLIPSVPLHARHGSIVEPPFPLLVCLPLVAWKTSNNTGGLRGIQVDWKNIKPPGGCDLLISPASKLYPSCGPWESHSFPLDYQLLKFGELQLVQIQDLVASNGFLSVTPILAIAWNEAAKWPDGYERRLWIKYTNCPNI